MEWTSVLAIYALLWVMSAFLMLPFGIKTHDEAGIEKIPGQADSAPANFQPGRVALRATVLAAVFCALYVAQGIPWGFMATTSPGYLTQKGLDFGFITTMLSFSYLPYSFKWIWGPIMDTVTIPRFGRRRPWILLAQALMALTVLAMGTFDVSTELKLLMWVIFIHTIFNALQDVAKGKVLKTIDVSALFEAEAGNAKLGNPGESAIVRLGTGKVAVIGGPPATGSVAIVDLASGTVKVVHAPMCN